MGIISDKLEQARALRSELEQAGTAAGGVGSVAGGAGGAGGGISPADVDEIKTRLRRVDGAVSGDDLTTSRRLS